MNEAKKPVLPHGWIVKQSSTYPDRVYYFNVNTGNSTWEAPTLKSELVRSIRVILNILLNESVISIKCFLNNICKAITDKIYIFKTLYGYHREILTMYLIWCMKKSLK
jgi:hypothetical protein